MLSRCLKTKIELFIKIVVFVKSSIINGNKNSFRLELVINWPYYSFIYIQKFSLKFYNVSLKIL